MFFTGKLFQMIYMKRRTKALLFLTFKSRFLPTRRCVLLVHNIMWMCYTLGSVCGLLAHRVTQMCVSSQRCRRLIHGGIEYEYSEKCFVENCLCLKSGQEFSSKFLLLSTCRIFNLRLVKNVKSTIRSIHINFPHGLS